MAKPTTKTRPTISEQAQAKIANPETRANLPSVEVKSRLPMPAGFTEIDSRQWRVLVETTFPMARTPESVMMAFDYCKARGLDVFKKPVHIVPMWNSSLGREVETVWPGINEVQITAARTGAWAGMDEPKWGPDKTKTFKGRKKVKGDWVNAEVEVTFPEWCSITVYRIVGGVRAPFTEPVYWLEACSRSGGGELPTDMWVKRPHGQLHKVAKAAGLRAAFPEEGEYTAEEMEGKTIDAGGVPIIEVEKPRVPSPSDAATPVEAEVIPPEKPTASRTAPAPAKAVEKTEDAVERLTPHELKPNEDSKSFPTWASRYIKAIAFSANTSELAGWREANKELLRRLEKSEENYARVVGAEQQMVDNLAATKPKEEAAEEPKGTLKEQSLTAYPDPEADPDKFVEWAIKKINTFSDYAAAQDYYNEIIDPLNEKLFPPDADEIRGALKRLEEKLAP